MQKHRLAAQLKRLDVEIAQLKREAKEIFSPGNFSKSALKERKAIALGKQKHKLSVEGKPDSRYIRAINVCKVCRPLVLTALDQLLPLVRHAVTLAQAKFIPSLVQVGIATVLCFIWWYEPIATVPTYLVAPSASRVTFPWTYTAADGQTDGLCFVSMMGWIFLADSIATGIVASVDAMIKL